MGRYWGSKKFKSVWKYIWSIFENEGTNDYATWVLSSWIDSELNLGESYVPEDKYYDWIGFVTCNRDGQVYGNKESLSRIIYRGYRYYRNKHPEKPIMIAEAGMDELSYKPNWVAKAFIDIKNKYPGIKGLSWWSENWSNNMNVNVDSR